MRSYWESVSACSMGQSGIYCGNGCKRNRHFFHQYLGDMFGIKSVYRLRNGLYGKLQRLSFSYYDNAKTGDLMSRLTADVEGLRFFYPMGLLSLFDSACWLRSAYQSCFTIRSLLRW